MLYLSKSKTAANENFLFCFVFSRRYLVTAHRELELSKLKKMDLKKRLSLFSKLFTQFL